MLGQWLKQIALDPMHQFEVKPLLDLKFPVGNTLIDASFTNASLFMVIAVGAVLLFLFAAMGSRALVPGRLQSTAELSYEFIADMIRSTTGSEGLRFFPFVFSLFLFVLACNILGMMPYSFTVTSHIIVTFALALAVIVTVVIVGFAKNGIGFLRLFVPSGLPLPLLPLIVLIEVISFLSRPISLAVRLFANMLAGHTMLKVFAGFVVMLAGLDHGGFGSGALGFLGVGLAILPFLGAVAITALEFLVAFLQAYVFAILTCVYLNDALHPHH